MKYLFVDNFRGFSRTLLPLKDVNFFVGENSTGKTSLLTLMKLLSTPDFWFRQQFYTEDVDLGNYNDIVSVNSSDKSCFTIGFLAIDDEIKNPNSPKVRGFLMTFRDNGNVPKCTRYTSLNGQTQIDIRLFPKTLSFRWEDNFIISNDYGYIKTMFLDMLQEHHVETYRYYKLRLPESELEAPIIILNSRIENSIRRKSRDSIKRKMFEPSFGLDEIVWLGPIRARPKPTYESYRLEFSPEGSHTPHLIKELLTSKILARNFSKFINKFGRASGLFQDISIKQYHHGRRGNVGPFELDITLSGGALNINNVGYGVSQVLPLAVELFARKRNANFAIQQPEIHLHPKAQAAFGDIVFELAKLEHKTFLIETHSDFAIESFRFNYGRKNINIKPSAQICFFERTEKGNTLHLIDILEDGKLSKAPDSFKRFFINHQLRLINL